MLTTLCHMHESQTALMAVHDMHEPGVFVSTLSWLAMYDDLAGRSTDCIVM